MCPERDHCNHGSCQRGQFSSYASENIPCSDFTQLETDSDNNGAFKKTAEIRDLQSFIDVSHRCNEAPCTHINIHTHAHTHTHTHTHTYIHTHTCTYVVVHEDGLGPKDVLSAASAGNSDGERE